MGLHDIIQHLPEIAVRLDAFDGRAVERRQINRFCNRFYPESLRQQAALRPAQYC
jgi:hypothetical protein